MKKIVFALLYTIALASVLAHFSGCYSVDEALDSYVSGDKKEEAPVKQDESDKENKQEIVVKGDSGSKQEQNGNVNAVVTPAAQEEKRENDDEDKAAVKEFVNSLVQKKDTKINETDNSGANIFFDDEKKATYSLIERCAHYSTVSFAILYKDVSCMHSVEYYMNQFPEISNMEVIRENSGVYYNGILVYYSVEMKEGAAYAYALRSGDTGILTKEEKYVLTHVGELSEDLKLSGLSDIEKIKTVHDFIVNTTQYDVNYAEISHTAYGLFRNGKAVCDGYAQAFLVFMGLNGIECQIVSGVAGEPVENHAWNQVKIGGEWYNIDVTFDDPLSHDKYGESVNNLSYNYFMVSDMVNGRDHMIYSSYVKPCTSKKYELYPYEKYIAYNDEDVRKRIEEQIKEEDILIVYSGNCDVNQQTCRNVFKEFTKKRYTYYEAVEIRDGWWLFMIVNPEI